MSGPTKGMVAGQPIKTGAQTREYDEGHERIFGKDRTPTRGRFVYSEEHHGMIQVGSDWEPTDRAGAPRKSEAEIYGNDVAQDGSDISSKKRRRDYMKREGVADTSDFTGGYWEKKVKERVEARSPNPKESTRQAVAEAWRKLRKP